MTNTQSHINKMKSQGWHLATHMTIMDRKRSYHCHIGRLHFIKPRKEKRV